MMLYTFMSILIAIGFGLYFLFFKKTKNKNSSVLGYSYLIAGAIGLFVTMFL